MNKLFKRTTAFVLMVCLLCALAVPAVYAAPAEASVDGSYVYDFVAITDVENYWWMNGANKMSYAGRQIPDSNSTASSTFFNFYKDGTLNWSMEAILEGSKVSANTKCMVMNNAGDSAQFTTNGSKAETPGNTIRFKSSNASGSWMQLKIKAPAVGTYKVTYDYSSAGTSGANAGNLHLIPAFTYTDAADFNAKINEKVTAGTYKLDGTVDYSQPTQYSRVADMGDVTLSNLDVEEYYLIITINNDKRAYFNSLTLTPVESEILVENRNYSIAGAISSGTVTLRNKDFTVNAEGVATVEALYDAGTIDWSWLGTNSTDDIGTGVEMTKANITNHSVLANKAGTENDVHAYEAYKLRSPGNGTFNISFKTYVPAAGKTTAWSDVYIAEYVEGMDPLSIVTEANFVGAHTPKSSANPSVANTTTAVGAFTFEAGKEYILVHKADGNKYGWPNSAVDENDRFYTANFYMVAFVIEPEMEFVPKAYIGTTPYATVAAAAAAAQNGETIKLAMDFVGAIDLPAGVSIDLNGYTWTVSSVVATNAAEAIIDSKGTGKLVTKSVDLFGNNGNVLPLKTADNTYALAAYELSVTPDDYEAVGSKTRFWFNLELDDAYLDMIAAGNTGMTIGVELTWGEESLVVTFGTEGDEAAFAAEWAAAKKTNDNIWLYVDIAGISTLDSDLNVKPILSVGDTTLNNGTITYTVG